VYTLLNPLTVLHFENKYCSMLYVLHIQLSSFRPYDGISLAQRQTWQHLDDGIFHTQRWIYDLSLMVPLFRASSMYTPRGNVPPRESVNADTNVHPYMCHNNGISFTWRRIGDIPLMGFSLLRGSRLCVPRRDMPRGGNWDRSSRPDPITARPV